MQFDSLAAALAMEGHGVYVWTVVVVSGLVIAALLLVPGMASRRFLRAQRSVLVREGDASPESPVPTAIIEEVNNAPGA